MKKLIEDIESGTAGSRMFEKWQHPDRWENCPSTHCERRGECASPRECSAAIRARLEK
jgi:hypothetical protein